MRRSVQAEAHGQAEARPGERRLGLACVGLGGAVATTAVAGIELIRDGLTDTDGLPLAGLEGQPGLAPYEDLVFGGWDLSGDDLASAARSHGVLDDVRLNAVKPALSGMRPWPAVGNREFCRNASGDNVVPVAEATSSSRPRSPRASPTPSWRRWRPGSRSSPPARSASWTA